MEIHTFYPLGYVAKSHWNLRFFANEASRCPLTLIDEHQKSGKFEWINRPMFANFSKWLGPASGDDKRNGLCLSSVCFDDCHEGGENLIVSGD